MVMDSLSFMVLLFLFTCIVLQFLHSLLARNSTSKANKLPPGPSPLPIIGNLLEMGQNPHQSLAKLATTHGPIITLKLGQVTTVVISSSHMAKEVLHTNDHSFSNRTVPDAVYGLDHKDYSMSFMPVSPKWRALRKICTSELFSNKALEASQVLRRKKVDELLGDIHRSSLKCELIEIGSAIFRAVSNLLSNSIFSVDLVRSEGDAGEFKDLVTRIMKEVGTPNLADFFPIMKMLDPQGIRRRTAGYVQKVIDIFRCLINQRLKTRECGFDTTKDMLDTLLNISQGNCHDIMTKLQIEHLFLTLFAASTDPITSTLEWAMTELICNPKAMSRAKQELEQIVGIGNPVEENDIASLPYLNAVMKETFRLHPPTPFLVPSKAKTSVEIGGYTIPKDAQVIVNVWAIGRDASKWDSPNSFLPERFLGSEIDVKGQNYELIPFGAGRRMCPSVTLSIRILLLILGSLINTFNWKLEDGMKLDDIRMDDKFGITITKAQPLRVVPVKIN